MPEKAEKTTPKVKLNPDVKEVEIEYGGKITKVRIGREDLFQVFLHFTRNPNQDISEKELEATLREMGDLTVYPAKNAMRCLRKVLDNYFPNLPIFVTAFQESGTGYHLNADAEI